MAEERLLYERILEDIKSIVSDNEYRASIIMQSEEEFWNNVVNVGLAAKYKFHDRSPEVFLGTTVREWKEILDEIVPTVRKLKWPIKTYQVSGDEEAKLKLPVIVSILHNVYDLGNRKIPEKLIMRNPEPPYSYIRMNTELLDSGITTQITENHARILYGFGTEAGDLEKYVHFVREEDMGIPADRTPEELGREPEITLATEIPALAALRDLDI